MGAAALIAIPITIAITGTVSIVGALLPVIIQEFRNSRPSWPVPPPSGRNTDEVEALQREVRNLNLDPYKYNFAFVGSAGNGKSSLINVIRGVEDNDQEAAQTTETGNGTQEITSYSHPEIDNLCLWDVPGGNTAEDSRVPYFMENCLWAFDSLMILINERFRKLDVDIAKAAKKYNVPFYFCRSKADLALKAKKRKKRDALPETLVEEVKREIYNDFRLNCSKYGIEPETPLFIISSWDFKDNSFDEVKLLIAVMKAAYERRMHSDIMLAIQNNS